MLPQKLEEADLLKSYRLGANSYLRKPVDYKHFTEVLREIQVYWLTWNQVAPAKSGI